MKVRKEEFKKAAHALGADLVGIASSERFEGAPPQADPRLLFPPAKSIIMLAKRIPRGVYRGIEEGTHWNAYARYGYGGLNTRFLPKAVYRLSCWLEDRGWEAMPMFAGAPEVQPQRSPVRPGEPGANVEPAVRIAAWLAGLGEIGYSKVFLTPEYGPRIRFGMIITDLELEADPIFPGGLCDSCQSCVRECPGNAIPKKSEGKLVQIKAGTGEETAWGDVHMGRCTLTHHGMNKKVSPFLSRDFPGLELDVENSQMTEEEAYKLTHIVGGGAWRKTEEFPSGHAIDYQYMLINTPPGYNPFCGAAGCIRACMIHLESRGKIGAKFHNPFRQRPSWLKTNSQQEQKKIR